MPSVRKRKNGKFELRYYEGGKQRSQYFDTKREADIERGKLAKLSNKNTKGTLTVREWLDTFLERQKDKVARGKLSPNTYKTREINLRKYIIDEVGSLYLKHLDRKYWRDFFSRDSTKTRAFQIAFETLRVAFNEAVDEGLLESNPLAGRVKMKPQHDPKARRILEADEIVKLLNLSRDQSLPAYTYYLILTALHTGMRQGELFALQWSDIDFKRKRIMVQRSATLDLDGGVVGKGPKTRAGRREITVSDILLDELKQWASEGKEMASTDALMFPNGGGQMLRAGNFMERVYRPLIERAGLEGVDFHALRHTNASHMIARGINVKVISYRLGHTSIKTTLDIYGHLLRESQDEAAGTMDRFS